MIVARKANYHTEYEFIKELLNIEGIIEKYNDNQIIYVIEDNEGIFGVSKVIKNKNIGILNYVVIAKNKRGEDFGDSLLRAIFNYCNILRIKEIYFKKHSNYLLKKGFKETAGKGLLDEVEKNLSEESVLFCDLEHFFSKGCGKHRK